MGKIGQSYSTSIEPYCQELECQECLGDRQIQPKCLLTEQPGLYLLSLDWLEELGSLKRIINIIAEEQMPTSVAKLTKKAEKKSTQTNPPETVTKLRQKQKLISNR